MFLLLMLREKPGNTWEKGRVHESSAVPMEADGKVFQKNQTWFHWLHLKGEHAPAAWLGQHHVPGSNGTILKVSLMPYACNIYRC